MNSTQVKVVALVGVGLGKRRAVRGAAVYPLTPPSWIPLMK